MHRTLSVPRRIGWWSLLVTLTLHVGLQSASAQPPVPSDNSRDVPVVMMAAGTTQTYQMSSNENLKKVENPNGKVLNVQKMSGNPKAVLFEAIAPGRTRVLLQDQKDRIEYVDVIIVSDRVKDLRDLIQRSVPNASVTVSANDSSSTVVLGGYVLTVDDYRVIRNAAKNLFGDNVVDNIRIGGVQQVQLEVVVAVVNRSLARAMSFSFNANGPNWFTSSTIGGPGGLTNILNPLTPAMTTASLTGTGANNLALGILGNNSSFLGFLQALRTEGLAKILAEPRVTTMSGRPGRVQSGGKVDIISSGVGTSATISAEFGTIVNFLPVVLGNGKINLDIAAEVSTPTNSIPIPGAGTPGTVTFSVLKRSANVTVQVEDGQTLAIGGLIQNSVNATISRVPVLGDLPFLGVAFTNKSYTETEEEIIIMITPRLVDPIDCTKIPKYLPGRETRSPDDYELFLEGIMEAPRGPRNVVFHPHLYQAAYKNAPNAGQIPCADGSCYGRGTAGCATGNCAPAHGVGMSYPRTTSGMASNVAMPANVQPLPNGSTSGTVSNVTMPSNFLPTPSVPAIPTSSSGRVFMEPEQPFLAPPSREIPPSLGPAMPSIPIPTIPARELQNRPVLPPLSSGGYTPN